MLHPFPAEEMKMYPVSTLVNKPQNDIPEVIKEREMRNNKTIKADFCSLTANFQRNKQGLFYTNN